MSEQTAARNPWTFVPILYFMQAMPVAVVQELSVIVYKDLGVANESITRFTSLIALPWTLKLFWGPLVDLNFTKRQWVATMQALLTLAIAASAFVMKLPNAFNVSLGVLLISAVLSATCDIATDGLYLLSLSRKQQAAFVGIQSTFYRLGRLFVVGVLVYAAGVLQKTGYAVPANWTLVLAAAALCYGLGWANLTFNFALPGFGKWTASAGIDAVRWILRGIAALGLLASLWFLIPSVGEGLAHIIYFFANVTHIDEPTVLINFKSPRFDEVMLVVLASTVSAGLCLGLVTGRSFLPKPEEDVAADRSDRAENGRNIARTALLIACAFFSYFTGNSIVRLFAHGVWTFADGTPVGKLKGWMLTGPQITAEMIQLPLCAIGAVLTFTLAKRMLKGTHIAEAFGSYMRQSGIFAILSFILFYRFGEAMVTKMAPLFLKDAPAAGGMGVPNEQLGGINGVAGVIGIVVGGILGGWIVSKFGLKRALWPLVLCMHLPNLLYLWAAVQHPPTWTLYGIAFIDQFGYGFGFAAYSVYLMFVAQRGNFRTSHYAIGTGLGALCIMIAGIVSGIAQKNLGYPGFFTFVIFATIPGMITLFFIPLEDRPQGDLVVASAE